MLNEIIGKYKIIAQQNEEISQRYKDLGGDGGEIKNDKIKENKNEETSNTSNTSNAINNEQNKNKI